MDVSGLSLLKAAVRVVVFTPLLLLFAAVSMDMKTVAEATVDGVTLGDVPTVFGAIPNFPLVFVVAVGVALLGPYLPARSELG